MDAHWGAKWIQHGFIVHVCVHGFIYHLLWIQKRFPARLFGRLAGLIQKRQNRVTLEYCREALVMKTISAMISGTAWVSGGYPEIDKEDKVLVHHMSLVAAQKAWPDLTRQ